MARSALFLLFSAVLMVGCQGNQKTDDANTGGGGIGAHQDHNGNLGRSSTDTGESPGGGGLGQVFGSGVQDPGNADSPTESNGGTGGAPPAPTLRASAQPGNHSNDNNRSTGKR